MNTYRIGIDCRLWNETGVGRYIRNLVWNIAQIDKQNTYILFFKKNEFEHVALPGSNFEKKLADISWHSIQEQILFPAILEKAQLHLVHFPYFSFPILYAKSFVVTIHDLIINHFPTGKASTKSYPVYLLKRIAYLFLMRLAVTRAKHILVPSKATKNEVMQHYNVHESKIIITPEGIDEKIVRQSTQMSGVSSPYFLYVGNGYPHKNLERLLEAFKQYCEETKNNSQLILVGKQDFFYSRLKARVEEQGLADRVLFYEKVSDSGLAQLYHNAIALIMPSLMEGFGLPALEAMAHNTLVMASDIASLKEVCAESAIYFDPMNTHSIAKQMEYVVGLQRVEKEKRKKLGLEQVKRFSWENLAKQTKHIYESSISV